MTVTFSASSKARPSASSSVTVKAYASVVSKSRPFAPMLTFPEDGSATSGNGEEPPTVWAKV